MAEKYYDFEFNGLLTKEEFFRLGQVVKRDDVIDEDELTKLVNWVIEKRTGAEIANMMIDGFLAMDGWDGNDPHVMPPDEIVRAITDIQMPMLEESNYVESV